MVHALPARLPRFRELPEPGMGGSKFDVALREILDGSDQVHHKAGGVPAVDDAVVVADGEGEQGARLDLAVAHHRLHRAAAEAKDGNLRAIDDGGEMTAADGALV